MSTRIGRIGLCTLALGLGAAGLAAARDRAPDRPASGAPASHDLVPPPKRDSVKLRFDKDTITVTFSRVEAKSERVFGKMIPFDTVWRIGGSPQGGGGPTIFRTTVPLQLTGVPRLEPGSYVLYAVTHEHIGARECQSLAMELKTDFSAMAANPWRLYLNTVPADSSTTYDETRDAARVIMYTCELDNFEEKLNIRLLRNGGKTGQVAMAWGEYQGWIDFRVLDR